jgi:hypothetical protein
VKERVRGCCGLELKEGRPTLQRAKASPTRGEVPEHRLPEVATEEAEEALKDASDTLDADEDASHHCQALD